MATVIVREYTDLKRDHHGDASAMTRGELVTDVLGVTIQSVVIPGSITLKNKTNFIEIEASADVRYAITPKAKATVAATALHPLAKANVPKPEAAYPSAVISFIAAV